MTDPQLQESSRVCIVCDDCGMTGYPCPECGRQTNSTAMRLAKAPFHTPIQAMLGIPGEPPACKVFSSEVSVHWYPTGARPGDKCLCGMSTMTEDA